MQYTLSLIQSTHCLLYITYTYYVHDTHITIQTTRHGFSLIPSGYVPKGLDLHGIARVKSAQYDRAMSRAQTRQVLTQSRQVRTLQPKLCGVYVCMSLGMPNTHAKIFAALAIYVCSDARVNNMNSLHMNVVYVWCVYCVECACPWVWVYVWCVCVCVGVCVIIHNFVPVGY